MNDNVIKILALDTATEACSAALYIDGEITQQYTVAPREHSRLILKMIEKLLQDADLKIELLDAIAFGRGPGAFMGIRIATGVVQGLSFAHDIPVIPVSNLMAIAQVAHAQSNESNILCAIDARMGEVYWAALERDDSGLWTTVIEECVAKPEQLHFPESGRWLGAGTGWGTYEETMKAVANVEIKQVLDNCLPTAAAIVEIAVAEYERGNTVSSAQAQPVYLRNDVAKKPKKKSFSERLNISS